MTTSTLPTIAAIATPPGRGGVGIVRVSGVKAKQVALALLGKMPAPRYATYGAFFTSDGTVIDQGLALYFPAPHSFTGEDVLELQGHGGPIILNRLLKTITQIEGVTLAQPGEFSERAFLNNKLDLAQAEAIADLIAASSEQAAQSALRSLQGEFSQKILQLVELLTHLRMYVEAAIDFPEEEINFLSDGHVSTALEKIMTELATVAASAQQGVLLQEGSTVVIAGRPNVGKSSLLNRLSGQETAIVTAIPGTTRDVLRASIQLDGLPLHIIDTAGLRASDDPVEQEGIRRAHKEISHADHLLLVMDAHDAVDKNSHDLLAEFAIEFSALNNLTLVYNKIDLYDLPPRLEQNHQGYWQLWLSAKSSAGISLLGNHLKSKLGFSSTPENIFSARRRHLDALAISKKHLLAGQEQLTHYQAGELLAEELRLAQQSLSTITGTFLPDDLLGKIFSSFCVGK